jgi:hypothetical protein
MEKTVAKEIKASKKKEKEDRQAKQTIVRFTNKRNSSKN